MDNRNRLANFIRPERNELKEDQLVCDKCNGTGCVPSEVNPHEMASICQKCQGDGWVDWISNITGKPPRYLYSSSGTSISSGTSGIASGIATFIADEMAQEIANQVDKDILKTVVEQANHKEVFF